MKAPVWNKEVDVVVVGSGGAGLTAALTAAIAGARVLVLEKAPGLGGTTIFSGALAWIPNNHLMAKAGIKIRFSTPDLYQSMSGRRHRPAMSAGGNLDCGSGEKRSPAKYE